MRPQTPKGTVKKRLVETNIRGKPVDKMTLYTKEGGNGPIGTVYGHEIANRPLSASVSGERLAKTHKLKELTTDMIVESDPAVKKEKIKGYKPFFEYPRDRIELKPQYKTVGSSIYRSDFLKSTPVSHTVLKADFFTTKHSGRALDCTSTVRNDYKPWVAIPSKGEFSSTRETTFKIPFAGISNYKTSYVNWGEHALNVDRPINPATVIPELKIISKSTYREDFKKVSEEEKRLNDLARSSLMNVNKLPRDSPIAAKFSTGHKTMYRDNFVKATDTKREKPAVTEEYVPKDSYPGQYKTIFSKDFADPEHRLYI